MAADKVVGVGVDTSQTREGFDRLRQSAETLARDIVRSSRAYSTSSKEVVSDIEDQIRAIEKRNKLDKEFREQKVRSQQQEGQITGSQAKEQIQQISVESKEDRVQTQLLRELIDTVKRSSKEEIRQDRLSVEQALTKSRTVDALAPEGDEFSLLKETLQKGTLGEVGQGEIQQKQDFDASRQGISTMQRLMGSSNQYEAVAAGGLEATQSIMPKGGIMGAIVGLTLGYTLKSLQQARPYAEAMARNEGAFGVSGGADLTGYGMNLAESSRRFGEVGRATGFGSMRRTFQSAQLERSAGLDMGTITELERSSRSGGGSAFEQTGTMISALRSVGAVEGGNFALLPEFMQTLISLNREQLNVTGEIDSGINTKLVAGISSLDDSFKNPEVLKGVVSSLRGGLTSAGTPQIEAMQYSLLSQIAPGASLFELQKMREDPFGSRYTSQIRDAEARGDTEEVERLKKEQDKSLEYLPKYLQTLESVSGGSDDRFFMNIMEAFGTSATIAEKIGKGFRGGDLQSVLGSDLGMDTEWAGRGVSSLEVSEAKFTAHFERTGMKMVNKMDDLIETIHDWMNKNKTVENLEDAVEDLKEFGKDMKEAGASFWNITRFTR